MIKIKTKYKQAQLDFNRKLKKTAKSKLYTNDLKPIKKEIRATLIGNGSLNFGEYRSLNPKIGDNVDHKFTGLLLASVNYVVDSSKQSGDDFSHTIHLGYINGPDHADSFENGSKTENVSIERIIQWMRKKKNFKNLDTKSEIAIAKTIADRISNSGTTATPIIATVWAEMRDEYFNNVQDKIDKIWGE